MKVEEIRINDIYRCKTDSNDTLRYVTEINNKGDLILNKVGGSDWEHIEANVADVVPVEPNDEVFKAIGAIKNPFGLEYVINVENKEFYIRRDVNSPLWVCARRNKYRPPFTKFRFIHELQRYILDTYMVSLKF